MNVSIRNEILFLQCIVTYPVLVLRLCWCQGVAKKVTQCGSGLLAERSIAVERAANPTDLVFEQW